MEINISQRMKIPGPFSLRPRLALAFILISLGSNIGILAQDPTHNYIMTTTYKEARANEFQQIPDADEAVVVLTYFDGLGRPKQRIDHKQSGDGDDLVTSFAYDGFGRQPLEFLPFDRGSATLNYIADTGNAELLDFYADQEYGATGNPWSEKIFEESFLNRVLEQAAPGNKWKKEDGHTIKFSYETNSNNEVHYYTVTLSSNGTPSLHYHQKYPKGQLYKTVTKTENWQPSDGHKGTITEYKDKMGRIVLKRAYETPIDGLLTDPPMALDTYYIYDDYGNLTFVLPPKLSHQIPANGSLSGLLDDLAYQYRYDYRNRLIEKKIPGKTREYMVYDNLDRIIATGPALSPFGDQAEGWLHTKYDFHDRVAYTLWKQGTVDGAQRDALANALPTYISEYRLYGSSTSQVNGVSFSYSNQVAPTSGYHVLTVNYYDDYEYSGAPTTIPTTVGEGDIDVLYDNTIRPKGLPTGSWTRQVESALQANGILSYTLYDKKSNPVRVKSTYSASGYTQIDTKFDFIGNPQYTKTQHKKDASGFLVTTKDVLTYTDQSRPLKHTHKINTGSEQLLSLNTYDELGRLKTKKVGGTDVSGATALQFVDYKYNARGWLTEINDVDNLGQASSPVDLFGFKINYTEVEDDINGTVSPLYNGNIAETFWRSSSDNIKRKYGYSYDHQNRLMDAYYQLPGTSVPRTDSYSAHYSYDSNGNILSLQRNGEQDLASSVIEIDDLDYTYNDGNLLEKVNDMENNPAGFDMNGKGTNVQFGYDDYGNLVSDPYKEITDISYNHLNLPVKITFDGGGKIEYFYDATGVKLKKKVTDGTTITTTNYMDGFQYTNGKLDFFPHAEGYAKAIPSGLGGSTSYVFKYVFNYTDHLGNIRVKYAQNPANGNQIEILEEDHYYPYGLKHIGYNGNHTTWDVTPGGQITLTPVNPFLGDTYKYKYNGKELNESLDYNMNEMDLRHYDPALGRWNVLDPVVHYDFSPYNAFDNNPVFWADPSGADAIETDDAYVFTGEDAQNLFSAIKAQAGSESDDSGDNPPNDYVFDENGKFVRVDENDNPHKLVIENSETGKRDEYDFNDPETDVASINSNIELWGSVFSEIKFIYFLSSERIQKMMKESDVSYRNWVSRRWYAFTESVGGKIDFSVYHLPLIYKENNTEHIWTPGTIFSEGGPLFIPPSSNTAYNHLDQGNYLWGSAMRILGFSKQQTVDAAKGYNKNDSNADIKAVKSGYSN